MAVPPASIERFDFDALHRAVSDLRSRQLFFIGGAPKSGTTWLQLLLNAHPEISCGGEGHFPNRLLPALAKALKGYNATIDLKNRSIFEQLDGQPLFTNRHALYLMAAAASLMLRRPEKAITAPVVGDKTPDNVRFFPLLAGLFPRAKFIHIVRDARDCTVSAWFHNLRLNPAQVAKRYPSFDAFSDHFAGIWVANVKAGANFAARHPGLCLTIRYEDLCDDPSRVLDGLCGFLPASRDPSILQACREATDFVRLSGGRSRGDEDRGSFFRRGVAGDWRGHFDATAERAFRAKVEPWMSNFRYAMENEQAA
jgi:hypothetical protein